MLACAYSLFAAREFDYGRDPAVYAGLARSIVSGDGYWFNGRPHVQYPPGYPLLLAPISWLTDHSFAALSRFTSLFAALAVVLAAAYARSREVSWWPLLLVVPGLSAAFFRHATDGLESEGPYMVASFAFLLFARRAESPRGVGLSIAMAFALLATSALRSIGIAMFIATILTCATHLARVQLARRRGERAPLPRQFAPLAVSAILTLPYLAAWFRWSRGNRVMLYRGEYMDQYDAQFWLLDPHRPDLGTASLGDVLGRIPDGIAVQGAHAVELFTNVDWVQPSWVIAPVLLAVLVVSLGLLKELRCAHPLMGWYLFVYFGFLAVWPFDEGVRFLVPVFPLLLLTAVSGTRWLVDSLIRGHPWARVALTTVSLGAIAVLSAGGDPRDRTPQEQVSFVLWIAIVWMAWRAPTLATWVPRMLQPRALAGVFILAYALLGLAGIIATAQARLGTTSPARNDHLREVAEWVVANTRTDDVVMAAATAGLHHATERPTVPFPATGNPELLARAFAGMRPDLLVVEDRKEFEYFLPTQGERLGIIRRDGIVGLREVVRIPGARIFRVQLQPIRDSLTTKSSR